MLGPGLMRWAGPLIAPPLFRDACLYLDFTSGVYADAPAGVLSRRRSFEDLVTFTRSGTAERINADLEFETVLAGKPRFMHDPAGMLPRRLAVEASETRINANPVASMAGWSNVTTATRTDLALGILGSFPGLKIASQGADWNRVGPPNWTLVNGQSYTVRTYYMEPDDGSSSGQARINGYAAAGAFNCALNGPVGALAVSATTGCTVSGVTNKEVLDGVFFCEFTVTNTSGSDQTLSFGVGPNSATSDKAVVALAQFGVAGSAPGSDILNPATANTTRAAEAAAVPMLHGGGAFTVLYDCYLGAVPTTGLPRVFQAAIAADVNDNSAQLLYNPSTNKFRVSSVRGGVAVGTDLAVGAVGRVRAVLIAADASVRASVNGSVPSGLTGLSGTIPAMDALTCFANPAGNNAFPGNCGLFQCSVISGVLSDAYAQSWSALP